MSEYELQKQRGVGLIEVLVTVLILATSLMALAALQTRSLQFNQGSYLRSQANVYAYDILDRMRSNTANFDPVTGTANLATYTIAAAPFSLSSAAVTAPLEAADIDDWRRNIATTLPDGTGAINCDVNRVCTVTIKWTEITNNSGTANPDEDFSSFVYIARI